LIILASVAMLLAPLAVEVMRAETAIVADILKAAT